MQQALADCESAVEREKAVQGQIRLIKLEVKERSDLSAKVKKTIKNSLKFTSGNQKRSASVLKRNVKEYLKCMNEDKWDVCEEAREEEVAVKIVKHQHKVRRNRNQSLLQQCRECQSMRWDHWSCKRCKFYLCDACLDQNRNTVGGEQVKGVKRKFENDKDQGPSSTKRRKGNDKEETD